MMETMIAIIIGLIVLAGVFVVVQMAFSGNQVGEARQNLMMSKANVKRMFSTQPDYGGLDNQLAIDAGIVPGSMITGRDKGALANAFGGVVTFGTDDGSAAGGNARGTDSHYTIFIDEVPQEACIELATYTRSDWEGGINVNGDSDVDPEDIAGAQGACNNDDNNSMLFVSR